MEKKCIWSIIGNGERTNMKTIMKKQDRVKAYQLGQNHPVELQAIREGTIRKLDTGRYELFSQEAVNGRGQTAKVGDYLKVDTEGRPYYNGREWFEQNHTYIGGDEYIQKCRKYPAWEAGDEICRELEFLLDTGRLRLNPQAPERYFEACMDDALLTAASDAVLVFYEIDRDSRGAITDCTFNFVSRVTFDKTYEYCRETT